MTSDEPRGTPQAHGRSASVPGPQPGNGATDPSLTERLDRYWDAVTGNGYQRAGAIALDPARARTVDQLQTLAHEHDRSAGLPPGAHARIWRATLDRAGIPTRQESPVTSSTSPVGGHAAPGLILPASSPGRAPLPASTGGRAFVPGGGRPAQPGGRALWPRLQFAVATVLILGLFATLLAPMDDGRVGLFGGTDSTPTTAASTEIPPSIGYPQAFTGGGSTVDLPVSATGHTVSLDRVTVAEGAMLTLSPSAARMVTSVAGAFTADRAGASPLTVDQPSQIDVGQGGGSIRADEGGAVTVTVLTIAPEGTAPLTSSDGVTVYPLTSYTTGDYRFETQVNVVFGNGPVPATPEQVGPLRPTGVPFSDTQGIAGNGTEMLLYAEQGSIHLASLWDSIGDPASWSEYGPGVRDLTLAPGEAVVTRDPFSTIQQATPGEGAVYTAVFLSPPPLDRTAGRTYPNTDASYGHQNHGPFTVPADGDDYRVVLDRLTLQPGAIVPFDPGTFRAVQWTGGGGVVMTVQGSGQSPLTIPNPTLNGSFGDQGFSLVANGDAPATLTLLSYLPASAPDETVSDGSESLTVDRLTAYDASNPSNADQFQIVFSATAAQAFPVEIDPGLDFDTGRNADESYALIRPEDAPITLDRPAMRIVDGRDTTAIAAGDPVPPNETVRVDDLREATISGPLDGSPAGYTIVIVSPYVDPNAPGAGSATPALTGLTPASLDAVADVPAGQPLNVTLVRQTLGPGASVTVSPGVADPHDAIDAITVLSYAAAGSGTIGATGTGQVPAEIASRSSDLATQVQTTDGLLTVTAGSDGLTLYQLIIGTNRPGIGSSSGAESVNLGTYTAEAPLAVTGPPDGPVEIRAMLRASVGSLGDGRSQTLGRDGIVTLLTPLAGDALIVPGVGDVHVVGRFDGDRNGAPITAPTTVAPDGGVIAEPGGQFRVGAIDDSLSFLWAEIELVDAAAPGGTPAATTPAAGTPTSATPVAVSGIPACDIAPRTTAELLSLYDEGVAHPVDPFTLGHRDDLSTGTPADDATIAAVTETLLRQSACQSLNDPLRQYVLSSDEYLRVILPVIYGSRDQLASLLEQPASRASAAALPELALSDVELFPDDRVGARVALDHEFAYVTFSQAPDGSWLIDLWDDRDQPGA